MLVNNFFKTFSSSENILSSDEMKKVKGGGAIYCGSTVIDENTGAPDASLDECYEDGFSDVETLSSANWECVELSVNDCSWE